MNNKLPYLVSISSYNEYDNAGIKRYFDTLTNAEPTKFELILIDYLPLFVSAQVLNGSIPNLRIYNKHEPYPGNLYRFAPLYELSQEMDDDRFIIFTDTYDVLFQKEFPNFEVFNRNEVLVANEGETWKESSWFPVLQEKITKVNFIQDMADKPILNAGTWAMRSIPAPECTSLLISGTGNWCRTRRGRGRPRSKRCAIHGRIFTMSSGSIGAVDSTI